MAIAGIVFACGGQICASGAGPDPPLQPVSVCDIVAHPDQYAGQPVLVLGRFSFRESGRFLSQDKCPGAAQGSKGVLGVVTDRQNGPRPPEGMPVDTRALDLLLAAMQKSTALVSFRFGSSDYDRWAMVYGRFDAAAKSDKETQSGATSRDEFASVHGRLRCRGETLVIFLRDQQ